MTDWKNIEDKIADWAHRRGQEIFLVGFAVVFLLTLWGM